MYVKLIQVISSCVQLVFVLCVNFFQDSDSQVGREAGRGLHLSASGISKNNLTFWAFLQRNFEEKPVP